MPKRQQAIELQAIRSFGRPIDAERRWRRAVGLLLGLGTPAPAPELRRDLADDGAWLDM